MSSAAAVDVEDAGFRENWASIFSRLLKASVLAASVAGLASGSPTGRRQQAWQNTNAATAVALSKTAQPALVKRTALLNHRQFELPTGRCPGAVRYREREEPGTGLGLSA